jgi:hypothetical protein
MTTNCKYCDCPIPEGEEDDTFCRQRDGDLCEPQVVRVVKAKPLRFRRVDLVDATDPATILAMMGVATEHGIPFRMGPIPATDLLRRLEDVEAQVAELHGILAAVVELCGALGLEPFKHPDVMELLKKNGYPCTEAEYEEANQYIDRMSRIPEEAWTAEQKLDFEKAADLMEAYEKVHYPV